MSTSPRFVFSARLQCISLPGMALRLLAMLLVLAIAGVFMVVTGSSAVAGEGRKGISQKKFDMYLANAIRGDRVDTAPYGAIIEGDPTYNLRQALFDLEKSSDWAKFTYEQRREFTFQILVHTHLNTGSSTLLLYMLGMDARPIAIELNQISNLCLAREYGLDHSGINWYRGNLRFFKGNVTLDYRPKTMAEYQ